MPSYKKSVKAYQKESLKRTIAFRSDATREPTGVFTGGYVEHPITGKKLPLWMADYVIGDYGSGAVMAVPAHDKRDFAFAEKYDLPIVKVCKTDFDCYEGQESVMINSKTTGLDINNLSPSLARKKVTRWLEDNRLGRAVVRYKLRDWLFSRQRYWGEPIPILHFDDGTKRVLREDELPLELPLVKSYKSGKDGLSVLAEATDWLNVYDDRKSAKRETHTMPQWAGSCWYYLRFLDPDNNTAPFDRNLEKYWMPVDLYVGGIEHAVLHLLYARFWHKFFYDIGLVSTKEPFQRLLNQGLLNARSYRRESGGYVAPAKVEKRGNEYYEIDSGEKLISQVEKMSKSKLNGFTPDDVVEEYGADALRLYVIFMGPFDKERIWDNDAIKGCYRLLKRFYNISSSKLVDKSNKKLDSLINVLIRDVTDAIENIQFNTAISYMMTFINKLEQFGKYPKEIVAVFAKLLNPFAPHIAEEVWELLGNKTSIAFEKWPEFDKSCVLEEKCSWIVQVNGRKRSLVTLSPGASEEVVLKEAMNDIKEYLEKGKVIKTIFIPDTLLNIVLEPS